MTLPLGAGTAGLAVQLYRQVNTAGVLSLPSRRPGLVGEPPALRSPFNFTVTGTALKYGFLVAPGTYSVYGSALVSGVNYSSLSQVTVNAAGVATPEVTLGGGVPLVATYVGPNNQVLNLTTSVYWSGPDGSQLYTLAVDGSVTLLVPESATCPHRTPTSPSPRVRTGFCSMPPTRSPPARAARWARRSPLPARSRSTFTTSRQVARRVLLERSAAFDFRHGPVDGTVPSTNVTVVTTSSGTFSAAVQPGVYTLYVTAGTGGGVFASLAQVAVPFPSTNVTVTLLRPGPTR